MPILLCYSMLEIEEALHWRRKKFARIQVTSRIRAREEVISAIIEKLREDSELISLENDSSKVPSFKCKWDPDSRLQVSSKGRVILTIANPLSFIILDLKLQLAIKSVGLSTSILEEYWAPLYRVERYPVRSFWDVVSLIGAQTILGARGRRRDQEED
jgi:hypothetical protein